MLDASGECVFCAIAAERIPSVTVIKSEHARAFLDIAPLAPGHTLVIPNRHAERLDQLSPDELAAVVGLIPTLARAILQTTQAAGYNLLQNNGKVAGQAVMHVHFHIIPRAAGDGLGYRWNAGSCTPEQAAELCEKIRAALP